MIGLSLGLCVADICEGKVKLKDVEKIISGLICRDEAAWDNVIEQYKNKYWSEYPEQAEKITRELLAQNKIEQPRLNDEKHLLFIPHKKWVKTEKQIAWRI